MKDLHDGNVKSVSIAELLRLDDMLTRAGIPHETGKDVDMGGANIKVPDWKTWRADKRPCASIIQNPFFYGGEEGRLEAWVRDSGKGRGLPVGWLTAERAFGMIARAMGYEEATE